MLIKSVLEYKNQYELNELNYYPEVKRVRALKGKEKSCA